MANKINKRQLRISWVSNAPWSPSGYSQQTADLEKKFLSSGWDGSNFSLINMFGQQGGIFKDQYGVLNYPAINHAFGSDALLHHGRHFKTDITLTLLDFWPQNPTDLAQATRVIPWLPVDYDPIPMPILSNLRFANRVISMSKFGKQKLAEKGFASTYIPHHVDTTTFTNLETAKQKAEVGIAPDTFVFGMVAANKDVLPRKSFQHVLDAFQHFIQSHPQSLLYIHTNPEQAGGFPVRQYAAFLGIANQVAFPDTYKWQFDTSKEEMNLIYNTFDAYLAPSSTEGFCIPIIEAQACGVPVIVNNYTSMPELIIEGKTGYITKPGCQHFMPIGSYMTFPDTKDLYEKMETMFQAPRKSMGEIARAYVEQNYSLDLVWDKYWLPFLDRIEQELYPLPTLTAASLAV